MSRKPEIVTGIEHEHPHAVATRHATHILLTQPGLVEKAGWVVTQGTETAGRIAVQTGKVLSSLTRNLGDVLPELGSAVGHTTRGVTGAFWNLFQSLRGKK
ncbi:MAG: hypothetical protein AAB489_04075 [Patescibacteria group bacterium]